MGSFTKLDNELKQAVFHKAKEISPSENMFAEINDKIGSINKEEYNMKLNIAKKSRGLLIACAVLALTTGACFAATKIVGYSGCLDSKFETFPTESQMKKEVGFVPKYVDKFENGYAFKEAFVGEYEGKDTEDNTVVMLKSAEFTYLKDDAQVYLNTEEKPKGVEFENDLKDGEQITVSGGQLVYYCDYLNKMKPGDYVMTEQDKIDEANGTYIFSFGENLDCVKHIQILGWEENSISYTLECYDDSLSKDDMLKMVEEIIKK
ncbi:MAG: hypothetical protein PHY44_04525 [Lachnospiraceae bacterium]|nr:hypothetical protein [Lachnospiraceae bacterium]